MLLVITYEKKIVNIFTRKKLLTFLLFFFLIIGEKRIVGNQESVFEGNHLII